MGYITYYRLQILIEEDGTNSHLKVKENIYNTLDELSDDFYGLLPGKVVREKWYDHDETFKHLSSLYPTVLFTVNGRGEEHEDIWIKYYMNGKCQREEGVISFPNFNRDKLLDI